ncbi:beta-galactosidase, partial [Candidatus Poribacteria bacterium]|nr:beta-galactosidase [Candidatus Poribacteria bacterium]
MTPTNIPRPEYPRPQFVRDEWLNLNGEWEFELDSGKSGLQRNLMNAEKFSKKIMVPFCPESELSGIGIKDFMPAVWYRREVSVPEEWAGNRILLHFGAVDYNTKVWINGKEAGSHWGGYTPFAFEVTDLLEKDSNVITVYAEDDTRSPLQASGKQCPDFHSRGCHYTRTTGIWQTVWMEAVPKTYIENVKLTPDLDSGQLFIEAKINGDSKGMVVKANAMIDGT